MVPPSVYSSMAVESQTCSRRFGGNKNNREIGMVSKSIQSNYDSQSEQLYKYRAVRDVRIIFYAPKCMKAPVVLLC